MVGEGFHGIHTRGPAPAGLGEGQVAADGQDAHVVGELGGFGVEASGLHVANRGIEGGHHAEDQHLALVVGHRAFGEVVGEHTEIRSRIAHGNAFAEQGQRVALKGDDAGTFFKHKSLHSLNGIVVRWCGRTLPQT